MKRILIFLITAAISVSCVDSLDEWNVDPKNATQVPAGTLFSNASVGLANAIVTPSVNNNNFRLYSQYWSTTTYLSEPRYNMTDRIHPQALWQSLYRDVISDLRESKKIIEADATVLPATKSNQLAQIEILEVMAWSVLVNTFGNVPYSESMDFRNPVPKFDDAKTVYSDLLDRLQKAITTLKAGGNGLGSADVFYDGSVPQWAKFGNTLMVRLALVIADTDAEKAKSLISAAVAGGVFESNDDNFLFPYTTSLPHVNPVAQATVQPYTTRQDFIPANTIVDPMNALSDPRRASYFTTIDGIYKGGNYGFLNTFSANSKLAPAITAPDAKGLLLDYSETMFGLAEAVERGFISGPAEDYYNKAVNASMDYWGVSPTDAATYLANPKVAYKTATGNYKEKIGFQKWIALYNRGWEGWVEWRRLDYPKLLPPTGGNAPAGLIIPVRIIYPIVEQGLNGVNLQSAASAIGGDLTTTKLWWDKN